MALHKRNRVDTQCRDGSSLAVVEAPTAVALAEIESAAGYASASRAENTRRGRRIRVAGGEYASRAENTRLAYASDLKLFAAWCSTQRASSLPAAPKTVAAYLAWMADHGRYSRPKG